MGRGMSIIDFNIIRNRTIIFFVFYSLQGLLTEQNSTQQNVWLGTPEGGGGKIGDQRTGLVPVNRIAQEPSLAGGYIPVFPTTPKGGTLALEKFFWGLNIGPGDLIGLISLGIWSFSAGGVLHSF